MERKTIKLLHVMRSHGNSVHGFYDSHAVDEEAQRGYVTCPGSAGQVISMVWHDFFASPLF